MHTETLDAPAAQTLPALPAQSKLRELDALPGPRGIAVLGNALQIESSRFHQQLEAWCDEFGPLFKLQIGKRKILVVGDHQMVAAIFRDRPDGMRRTSRFEEIWREMKLPMGVKRVSMPFGAGLRICPGRYLALLEMKMAMAVLLGNFDIESVTTPDGLEAREHLAFTMAPVGLRMKLKIRG